MTSVVPTPPTTVLANNNQLEDGPHRGMNPSSVAKTRSPAQAMRGHARAWSGVSQRANRTHASMETARVRSKAFCEKKKAGPVPKMSLLNATLSHAR